MAMRKVPFAIGEWYHCYNRGVDKRITYEDRHDYERFLEQIYLANSSTPLRRDDLGVHSLKDILRIPKEGTLVAIGAFCLMPNHFHLVLKETAENGTTTFMQKLGTAYTMYFNGRYERTGNLFMKPFRSQHIDTDRYFQHLINYVHCNPAELYEPKWKTGILKNFGSLADKLMAYPYSSLAAYGDASLPTRAILDEAIFDIVRTSSVTEILRDARAYYLENPKLP